MKRVFYSAFVLKRTEMCKHRFRVQLLQNPPLCTVTRLDVIFRYPDWVPLTHFVHRAKKKVLACGPEFSVEFYAPPEFSGGVMEK